MLFKVSSIKKALTGLLNLEIDTLVIWLISLTRQSLLNITVFRLVISNLFLVMDPYKQKVIKPTSKIDCD